MRVESGVSGGVSGMGGDGLDGASSMDAQAANLLLILQQEILAGMVSSQQNSTGSVVHK